MAFTLPAWDRNKRVKYIGPDGAQMPQEDRRWHWLQAQLTEKLAQGSDAKVKNEDELPSEKPEPKQLTPREALERIHAARGEIDVILDLVSGIEDGQHLAIGGVTPGQKSLQSQNRERALVLSAKQTQLQGAAARLVQGAELLSKQLQQDDRYFSAAAELQKHWKLKASPLGHAAPLQVDISLPFKIHGRRETPAEQLPLQRLPDGSVQIRHKRQRIDAGLDVQQSVDGISRLLHREQRKLLWASLKRVLEAEATETETEGDAAHALIQKMVSCASSESPGTQQFAAILLEMFLEAAHAGSSAAAGHPQPIFKRAASWLQHSALRQEVEAALQAAAGASEAPMQISWLPAPGRATAVARLRPERGPPFSLIITEEKLYLEGAFPESVVPGGVAAQQRRMLPGRKQIRRDQLHSLPALTRACLL